MKPNRNYISDSDEDEPSKQRSRIAAAPTVGISLIKSMKRKMEDQIKRKNEKPGSSDAPPISKVT